MFDVLLYCKYLLYTDYIEAYWKEYTNQKCHQHFLGQIQTGLFLNNIVYIYINVFSISRTIETTASRYTVFSIYQDFEDLLLEMSTESSLTNSNFKD